MILEQWERLNDTGIDLNEDKIEAKEEWLSGFAVIILDLQKTWWTLRIDRPNKLQFIIFR